MTPIEYSSDAQCRMMASRVPSRPGLVDPDIMARSTLDADVPFKPQECQMSLPADNAKPATTLNLSIEGMTCASCVARVEKALARVPGVGSVVVNLVSERADIRIAGPVDSAALAQAVEKAGYRVRIHSTELAVQNMTCASCVGRVERALKALPGVTDVVVNLATERASVQGSVSDQLLLDALTRAGYPGRLVSEAGQGADADADRKDAERKTLWRDLLLAAALALPVFVIEMGAHMIPGMHGLVDRTIGMQNSWYLQFILTTLVLVLPGRRFYQQGFPALLRLAPDMNSLVAVGTSAAYCYSVVATFMPQLLPAGTVNVYYEAAAVIVALILLGRYLEARARGRTSEAIQRLVGLQARTARVQRDGRVIELPIGEVVLDDVVEVRPG